MKRFIARGVLAASLFAAWSATAANANYGSLDQNCASALAAIEQPHLAGVFTFIPEKELASAFADLLARSRPATRRYLARLEKDKKIEKSLTAWDHAVVVKVLGLYASPQAANFEKPDEGYLKRFSRLSLLPTRSGS